MNPRRIVPLLFLLAPACLENEERIEVSPNGSVSVTLISEGDALDLADGHPIPLGSGWSPRGADTERWLRELGPDTGSPDARRLLGEIDWPMLHGGDRKARLEVQRSFVTVNEMPEWLAPVDTEYRSALLRRSTTLEIRDLEGKRVYLFERVFHGFDSERLDLTKRLRLPDEIHQKLESAVALSADERRAVIAQVESTYEAIARDFVSDAFLGLYVEGEANLPLRHLATILDSVGRAIRSTVTPQRITVVLDASDRGDDGVGDLLEDLEADWRKALRNALKASVNDSGLPESTRNAALYALEWQFTAFDQHGDLDDENFVVRVALPGTIVGGNYQQATSTEARWEFKGRDLHDRDVVLRAVSVLEDAKTR